MVEAQLIKVSDKASTEAFLTAQGVEFISVDHAPITTAAELV